jgi:hypothetical protein
MTSIPATLLPVSARYRFRPLRALAVYWSARLGNTQFIAYQAAARGGALKVRLEADRVFMAGQAVTVMRAELLVSSHAAPCVA